MSNYRHLTWLLIVAAAALLCAAVYGCKPQSKGADGSSAASGANTSSAKGAKTANLLQTQELLKYPPLDVSINRAGDALLATMTNPKGPAPLIYRFTLQNGALSAPEVRYETSNMLHSYLQANPEGTECLVLANNKVDGAVRDVIFRLVDKDTMAMVYYDSSPGIPTAGKPDTFYNLEPFYTWDGDAVVAPLKSYGLTVTGLKDKQGKYAAYPKLPFAADAMAFGPLPTENNQRRIWGSFWKVGSREDQCQLFSLDLTSMQWKKVIDANWAIYHVAGADFDNAPWVVAGSRAPDDAAEGRRFARFGRIDPSSGAEDLAEFYGTPDFEVALEPHGKYIAYTDSARKAIVRLNPGTGELDIDPRWYADDAKLLISEGGEQVFAYKQGALVHGEWSKHEKHKGWDSE
jgi:hypothetical protein